MNRQFDKTKLVNDELCKKCGGRCCKKCFLLLSHCLSQLKVLQKNTVDWVDQTTTIYFSQLWRPEVQDQRAGRFGAW